MKDTQQSKVRKTKAQDNRVKQTTDFAKVFYTSFANQTSCQYPLLPHHLFYNAIHYPNHTALIWDKGTNISSNTTQSMTWQELLQECLLIARSLLTLGHQPNDKVAIFSYNCKEWLLCYLAVCMIQGIVVSVYHSSSSKEVSYILSHSEANIVFVGHNPQWNNELSRTPLYRLSQVIDTLSCRPKIITFEQNQVIKHNQVITWNAFMSKSKQSPEPLVTNRLSKLSSTDLAAIIYTSGTTGSPKGVELSYQNYAFVAVQGLAVLDMNPHDRYISWLPLAHVFAQFFDLYVWVFSALQLRVLKDPLNVLKVASQYNPHLFIGVPRIYEKIYSNLRARLNSKKYVAYGLKLPILNCFISMFIKKKIGFSKLKYAISGAAPIHTSILNLFESLRIPLTEGYGLTETCAGFCFSFKGSNKLGSVGRPLPGCKAKLAKDGELLLSGPNVFAAYHKDPVATDQSFEDGWFKTGDIADIDSEGFVYIKGRKKEIYVLSNGKNIAPLVIEESMKTIPLVSQVFLIADQKHYAAALISLDIGALLRDKCSVPIENVPVDPVEQTNMLKRLGKDLSDFTESEQIYQEIKRGIEQINKQFSRPEQIKRFKILPRDFSQDEDELTPTLKMKRRIILKNWKKEIQALYEHV